MNVNELKQKFYIFCSRTKILIWSLFWTVLLILVLYYSSSILSIDRNQILMMWGIFIIIIVLLLVFPAWLSLRFRYFAWGSSKSLGRMRNWLVCGWRPALFLILGTASMLIIREIIINYISSGAKDSTMAGYHLGKLTVEWITLLSPDFWVKVFAISSLTFLIYWSYKSKKRIVITNFLNQTGDESMKSSVDAISAILLNELAALVRLYSIIDESNPYAPGTQDHSDREKSIDPNINVSGVGESLKSAVASDSKVKL